MEYFKIFLLLALSFVTLATPASAQKEADPEMISYYLHIRPKIYKNQEIVGFELFNLPKRNQTSWTSPLLKPLQKDSLGYLVKVDIPPL
jgi:hypothetical protein